VSRRHCQPPHRDSSHEQFLRDVVDVFVADESLKPAYLAFARELMLSLRRRPKAGDSPTVQRVGLAAVQALFSARTKRVVMKWFERGLHGRLLWLVGSAAIRGRLD